MTPLVPATFELRCAGAALLAWGAAVAAVALPSAGQDDLRAAGVGLAASLLVLWCLWGSGAIRRATRLALPVGPRWSLEPTGTTLARVAGFQVLPFGVAVMAAAVAARGEVPGTGAAAGVLAGAGITGLLCASRVRRAERSRGRRLLREPRLGRPLDRRSFYLEPQALDPRPSGRPPAPWPAHRPPPHVQRQAIELEPANGAARHPNGVRYPRTPTPPGREVDAQG